MNVLRLLWIILLVVVSAYVGLELFLFVLLSLALRDWVDYQ